MILVLGGYGGFGARVSRRLGKAGHAVLVAGRSLEKARAFCAGRPNLVPLALDRDSGLAAALTAHRPFAVVDAAGPFQGLGFDVPKACIAAGCHYLDLADGRAFVTGIAALDEAAKAAGVCVIAGASSVPALSGAAIRALMPGFDRLSAVEMAISASNKATAGPSVTEAILSYVGKSLRLRRFGRWETVFGWSGLRREQFRIAGGPCLKPRLVALADVPDLDLVPDRLPGHPAVSFRAGTELSIENITLWALAWLVRWGWISSLRAIGAPMIGAKRLTIVLGTDRSGMVVRLFGHAAGRRVERTWTLIASDGDGPEIPALAVPILIDRLKQNAIAPGARDAGPALRLADFEPAFAGLSIRHAITETPLGPSLFRRALGQAFFELPPAVQAIHDVLRDGGAMGAATVARSRNLWARLIGSVMRFPPEGAHTLHVGFAEREGIETWRRGFGSHVLQSEWSARADGLIVERFGLFRFAFRPTLEAATDARGRVLFLDFARWWIGPLPMPRDLAPNVTAREWEEDGRFQFDVRVPAIIHYRGWLQPDPNL